MHLTNRKVKHVQIVGDTFISGIGTLNKQTLDSNKAPGLEMHMTYAGVYCTWRGVDFILPFSILGPITLDEAKKTVTDVKAA